MRVAAYVFGTIGVVVSLVGGSFLLLIQLSQLVGRFVVPPQDFVAQSAGLTFATLGSGVLATAAALTGIVGLGMMAARTRVKTGPILLLVAALGVGLVLPVMLVGYSGSFIPFLVFPLLPAALLLIAAVLAIFAKAPETPAE